MPVWVAALFTGSVVAWIVKNVLAVLGVGVVTYVGADALLAWASGWIRAELGGVAAPIAGILGLLHVDFCINIIFSAYSIRAARMAVGSFGRIKR